MRKRLIAALLALALALALAVGNARMAWSTARIAGHTHPIVADQCPSSAAHC
jgi:hypothetical protein